MEIERRFKEETEWKHIPQQEARRKLADYYIDVDLCFQALFEGQVLDTPFAQYRKRED